MVYLLLPYSVVPLFTDFLIVVMTKLSFLIAHQKTNEGLHKSNFHNFVVILKHFPGNHKSWSFAAAGHQFWLLRLVYHKMSSYGRHIFIWFYTKFVVYSITTTLPHTTLPHPKISPSRNRHKKVHENKT